MTLMQVKISVTHGISGNIMRIPTREEQARYGALNAHDTQRFNVQERTPNMQLQINADMFGAGQARAMGQGAQELQRGARQIAHWYNQKEEVKGEDNYNKLLQEANEGLYGKSGILMQKGAAGKDAAVNAEKFLAGLSDKYLQGLSDVAQQSFMDRTQRFANHTMTRAHVHAAEEDRANTLNIHDASMASAKDNALRNAANPEAFNDYAAQYMQALTLKEQVMGSPQEKIDMKRKEGLSGLYMDKVQGLIVGGDLKGARAAVNVGGMLEQDKMRALGVIKQEEKRMQAESKTRAMEAMYTEAETTANNYSTLVENGDMTASQALLEMRNNIKDPKLQRAAMGSFSQLNQLKNMAQEEYAMKSRGKASDDFDKAGGNLDAQWKILQNANRVALSETATKADKHYARQAKALYDSAAQFSDPAIRSGSKPEAYEDVLGGIANGTYTSEAALKSSEQWPYLTPAGRKTALTTLKENQGFEMREAKDMFKSWFREKHGREYSSTKDKGMMDDAMSFVQKSIQGSNRGKEPDYVQKALDLYVMSSTIPNSGKIWDDSGEYGRLNKQGKALPVIDEKTRSDIEALFNKNIEMRNSFMNNYGNLNAAIRGYYKELKERELGPHIKQQDGNHE